MVKIKNRLALTTYHLPLTTMKLYDQAQNLVTRVGIIQVFAFTLLVILGVRLYYLQVVKGEYYSEKAENQRVRFIPIPAPRGAIFLTATAKFSLIRARLTT